MGDYTRVNDSAMAQGINDLQQAHTRLTSELSDLEGKLNSSLAQWEGNAREAYREAKARWDAAADKMSQIINTMRTVMTQIQDNYTQNERNVQNSWG